MRISDGYWSITSNTDTNAVLCQIVNTPIDSDLGSCDAGYKEFQGNCYKSIPPSNSSYAQITCQQEKAQLASIHSTEENQFITGLVSNTSGGFYTRIGLYINPQGNYQWADFTPFNYSNFGNGANNANFGACVTLALQDDAVNRGQWINSKCNRTYTSVCKKPISISFAPITCNQTQFLSNSGSIYSPGYPNPYISNKCMYIMSVSKGQAKLTFKDFNLDSRSYIQLFNDVADTTPFATLRYTDGRGRTYYSTENEMKMVFYSPLNGTTGQIWQATFGSN